MCPPELLNEPASLDFLLVLFTADPWPGYGTPDYGATTLEFKYRFDLILSEKPEASLLISPFFVFLICEVGLITVPIMKSVLRTESDGCNAA